MNNSNSFLEIGSQVLAGAGVDGPALESIVAGENSVEIMGLGDGLDEEKVNEHRDMESNTQGVKGRCE